MIVVSIRNGKIEAIGHSGAGNGIVCSAISCLFQTLVASICSLTDDRIEYDWGKKDTRTIEKILGMGMLIGIGGALAFALAAELIPETLLRIYTNDPEVIAEGVKLIKDGTIQIAE